MKGLYTLLMGLLLVLSTQQLAGQDQTSVTVESATAAVGQEVCLQITGDNFDSLFGFQFSLNYDPDALTFTSAAGAVFFFQAVFIQNNSDDGTVRVLWNIFSNDELTMTDPFSLGEICFIVEQEAEVEISISSNPIPIDFNGANGRVTDLLLTSGFVNEGVMAQPTCTDGIMNGDETGVDCGGSCDPCMAEPTCDDGVMNGDETGIDCGGSCDPCVVMPTCTDGMMNGDETGIDCGGSCAPCMAEPTCDDGIMNGTETGIDCGGSCDPCVVMPTCTDGVMNGDETGIDCGGSCAPCMVNTDDLVFALNNTSGATGTQVCMDVTTQNFSTVGAFQFSMDYDPAVLSFVNATNLAFTDINVAQPAGTPGEIRVSWVYFQPDLIGGNIDDGDVVFTLCFNVTQATGTTVSFTGSPIGIEAFDTNNNPLDVMTNNGTVNGGGGPTPTCFDGVQNGTETGVDCGGSCTPCATQNECTVTGNNLTMCLSDECAEVGEQACVDIEVNNFNDVTGMEFRLNYAAGNLNFVSKTDNPAFFGPVNVSEPNPGQLVVIWFDQSSEFQGVDIPDGENVMTFCFEAENEINTPINLSLVNFTDPTGNNIDPVDVNPGSVNGAACGGAMPNCNDGIQNNGETGVDCGGPNCAACETCFDGIQNNGETGIDCGGPNCITCDPVGNDECGVGSSQLFFCAETACADVGSQVCLDVNTTNFTSIVGFEFRVVYPGANLQYVSGSSSSALPGTPAIINPTSDGEVRVLWFDQTSEFAGGTIPAGESVVNLCFNVESALTTPITLTQQSASSTTNSSVSPVNVTPGSVNASACSDDPPTCTDGIQNGSETGVDCGGPDCAPCTPTCNDGIQNNGETGVDCGGPNCAACPTAEACGENSSELFFCAASACGEVGSQVCMDINTTNFTSIVGFEFRVIYPGANLEYVSGSSSADLPGTPAVINPTSDGEIRVLWFDQTAAFMGGTISAGESVVNLCFNVESAAASSISLTQQSASSTTDNSISPVNVTPGSINAPACNGMEETCTDGIQNNGETGIDCGGPNCAACPPTCMDGIQNNGETGIDCGGPNCAACPVAEACGENSSDLFFCAESGCGDVGTQLCLNINTTNFTSIVGFEFRVVYPGANLQYVSGSSSTALPGSPAVINPTSDGEIRILWFDQTSAFIGGTIPAGESVVNLCFNVESATDSPITITQQSASSTTNSSISPVNVTPGSINASACNDDPETCTDGIQNNGETGVDCGGPNCAACPPTCTDGILNNGETEIDCGGPNCAPCMVAENCGENSTDLFFCAESACGDVGSQVCIDVNTTNFTSIVGFEFRVVYPGANLQYVSGSSSTALPGSPAIINPTSDGEIRILWFDQTSAFIGGTIPAGESLVNLCFNVESATNSPITITQQSASSTTNSSISPVNVTAGSINAPSCNDDPETCTDGIQNNGETGIDCGGPNCAACPPTCNDMIMNGNETGIDCGGPDCVPCNPVVACGEGSTDLFFCTESLCGDVGSQVCFDINTTNFTSIVGFEFRIIYPGANLEYVSGSGNALLPGSPPIINPVSDGEVRVLWFDQTAEFAGGTIPAGESLVNVCFTVQGAGSSTINLTQQSASDVDGTLDNVQVTPGTINGMGCGGTPETCTDGILNNGETQIDCGGPNCAACPPTCTDGIQNGSETGVDCGGPDCPECPGDEQGDLTLSIADGSGSVGEQVCLNVTVADFIAVQGLDLTLNYNSALLQVSSITASPNLPGFNAGSFTTPTAGTLEVDWTGVNAQGLSDNAVLFTVCFTIIGEGTSTVDFTSTSTITDGNGMDFAVISNAGTITGINDFENLTFIMGSGIGAENSEVCLEMPVYNFTDVTSFSFTINYDPNKVTFNQIVGNTSFPPGGNFQVTNPIPGEVRVIWLYGPPDFAGITATDGSIIMSACFTVVEACETAIEITGNPTDITATDNNGETLEVDVFSGTINDEVPCGSCEPENLILDISDASGTTGTEICLDVDVENFNGMTDLQFTLNYDPAVLEYAAVNNFGLGSVSLSNFTIGPAGRIIFDWSSPNSDGQSLVDGSAIFSVCFTILDVEETDVTFTNTPTPTLAQNGCGANVGVVPMGGKVNEGAPMGDDLTLQIVCQDAAVNQEVCVPIQTFNFTDMLGFQFSINYDPALLDFVGIGPDPALNILVNESASGEIRISWTTGNGFSVDLEPGEVLTELCFTVLSLDAAAISFSGSPLPIEFTTDNGVVTPTLINCAINSDGGPQIDNISITQPTCHDAADGSIELTVSGSTNLAFNWNPNPGMSTGPILTNVSAGQTYNVEVIDLNTGESVMEQIIVPTQTPFTPQITSVQGETCFGESDGSITITPAGGMGPYVYDWSGNLQDNIPEQTGLDGGIYGVTVSDDNGCVRVFDNIQVAGANEISIQAIINDITEQPGSITVGVLNAAMPFSCSWTGPEGFTSMECNLNGLTLPGTYCLSVLDNNGCTEVQCYALREALRIDNPIIDEGCENMDNGSIDLSVIGGINSYIYSWEGPDDFTAITQDINGLAPGVYVVTVTSGSDMVTGSFTINEPDGIVIAASITTADMGSNGAIDITPSGGTPPYTYLWDNGEMTQDIDMLEAGEYCVTVTDSRGCERSNCYTVESIPISGVLFSVEDVSCIGAEDGSVSIVISNGVAPYVASTTPGGFTASSDSDTIALTLPTGTYDVTVTDNQGGTFVVPVTVGEPTVIAVVDTSIVSDTEDAQCTGSITLMISGGTGDHTVEWNLPGLSGPQVTDLCAGDYSATITDANGCMSEVVQLTIGQLTESATTTEVQCEGDNSGTIDLTTAGGVAPYTFAWCVIGETDVFAVTEDVSGLTNGEYVVTIVDATGATLVRTYEVETAIGFSFTTSVTSNFSGFGVTCNGSADGSASIDVSGMGTYTYEWFLNDNLVSMDQVLTNAAAGTYTVSVLSDAGCEEFGEVIITEPNALSLQSSQTDISCVGERDGALSVQVSGGVGPFNYTWSNGSTLPQAQFLRAGDYSVVVTDGNGCTISQEFTISEPEELVVTTESTDADDGCNGTVTILPLGGAGNYNYRWPQLPAQGNNPVARGLCPGIYEVEIFDDNDCQTVTVTAEVRDRRFPCLSERNVITPNGDGLNEAFILFCTDGSEILDNELEIYNRWGQLVYKVAGYNCSVDGGLDCFEGRTNDGSILPEGPYYYVLDYFNPLGERRQKRGSITIVLE